MAATERLHSFPSKPRVFIISDISNEPDDAESLVRYLLYANQFDTEGLVACTSTWMRTKVCPQDMHKIIDGYAGAVENLNKHAHPDAQYPSAEKLHSLVRSGPPVYGLQAVGDDIPLSEGASLLLSRITAPSDDDKPLWILCWGGTNVLAQALHHIQTTHPPQEAAELRSRLRIYTISDQDDTAPWIRARFPDLFYIASIHAWNAYGLATWTGISGDEYYRFDVGGPDFTKMTKEWLKTHIQIGPLGSCYPDYMFIPEGDTPTFLYLIQNGLGVPEQPSYGSWGGRYQLVCDPHSGHAQASRQYSDAADTVVGKDGRTGYTSNQATIWRWRDAFQNDFAARMRWTVTPEFGEARHHPVVCVNGELGTAPVEVEVEAGSVVTLDARGTYSPDERDGEASLRFRWWQYHEPSATQWFVRFEVGQLDIKQIGDDPRVVEVVVPGPETCCVELLTRKAVARGQVLHLILEVTGGGESPLTSYRRVLVHTTNKELKGGLAGDGLEAVGDRSPPQ